MINAQLPDPESMFPRHRIGNPMCRLSICVNGWSLADLQDYMNSAILVCLQRGFTIQAIGLPQAEMGKLSDSDLDVLGMGSYQNISLYVQDDDPVGAELEFVFAC